MSRTIFYGPKDDWGIEVRLYSDTITPNHIRQNLDSLNTDGSFTMANSKSFLRPYEVLPVAQKKQIFTEIFLFYHEIVCCVYSLELPHQGNSNEYTQRTIIV